VVCECDKLILSARKLQKFRGSLWDAEMKRWLIYRPLVDEYLRQCRAADLSDHPALIQLLPRIGVLDQEWEIACELRKTAAAGAGPQNIPDVGGNYQAEHGRNLASDEINAAIAADYAAVLKQHDDEGRRRVIHDQRIIRIERIRQRLATGWLKDRAHLCVWDIIEDRAAANPDLQAAYLNALVAAANAGLFNEGKRQQSQLFSFSPDGRVIRWDKKSLATFQQATDAAAHQLKLDRDKYRLQRLESLAKGAWMPRRFIARWLTEYCKLSRPPWWLEDETPDDLRGELERAHADYVGRNGKDEWDGFGSPVWSHGQAIIWRVSQNREAVDKASPDAKRHSLGEHYGKNLAAAVIELYNLNIGEMKDAARELRRLCLAGDLTAYDGDGNAITPMAWLPLEIEFDTENRPWVMRHGVPADDVTFRRRDVLRVWPGGDGATAQPDTSTPQAAMSDGAVASEPSDKARGDNESAAVQPGASIGTAKAEANNAEKEQGGDPEQQGTRVPRRQRLPEMPLNKRTGHKTALTAAWEIIGLHKGWEGGPPLHLSFSAIAKTVNTELQSAKLIDPGEYWLNWSKPSKRYEISEKTVRRCFPDA
jgi:hypothetical protein